MRKGVYARLAADNIKRNSQTYIPYILTCIITTAMTYIIRSLATNAGLDDMQGGYALKDILSFGSHITRIFAFIFLFYTNSFLMKRRKKEFGLLNILGMEKRHIAKMLMFESLYTAAISITAGFAVGILLDKLLFLTLTKMLGGNVQLGFHISEESIVMIAVFMIATFLVIYINALRQIHIAKPIELLHGSSMGEKEPRAKWLTAILGIALLGSGYYISIVTTNPIQALSLFFVAVLCVILGTYLFFTAGSIALLKILKKNKRYYYKTNHFTTVSGMIYRMKQNAVGLANICILSTMVLVMISTTSCLLAGIEDIVNEHYSHDFSLSSRDEALHETVEKYLSDNDIAAKNSKYYTSLSFMALREGNAFYIPEDIRGLSYSELSEIGVIELSEYNRLTGADASLDENSVLLWSDCMKSDLSDLVIMDVEYSVAKRLEDFPIPSMGVVDSACIVVRDRAEMMKLFDMQKEKYGENASDILSYYKFDNASGNDREIYDSLSGYLNDSGMKYSFILKSSEREEALSLYGGLFFLGAFLGILFLMQTILIIYYKQISEGFDDKQRFEIMQKVGMSRAEVKKSIRSQIITVFFLPLTMAGIHTAFAFPLIRRLLLMFSMTNTKLFIICLLISFGAFALIYALIYSFTARTYYKIVSK